MLIGKARSLKGLADRDFDRDYAKVSFKDCGYVAKPTRTKEMSHAHKIRDDEAMESYILDYLVKCGERYYCTEPENAMTSWFYIVDKDSGRIYEEKMVRSRKE